MFCESVYIGMYIQYIYKYGIYVIYIYIQYICKCVYSQYLTVSMPHGILWSKSSVSIPEEVLLVTVFSVGRGSKGGFWMLHSCLLEIVFNHISKKIVVDISLLTTTCVKTLG